MTAQERMHRHPRAALVLFNEPHCSLHDFGKQYCADPCDERVTNGSSERACSLSRTGWTRTGRPSAGGRFQSHLRRTVSLGFAALASASAWFGIRINAWYGVTLGKTRRGGQPDSGPQCVGPHSRARLAGCRPNAVGRGASHRLGHSMGALDPDSRDHPQGNAWVRGAEHRRYHRGTRQDHSRSMDLRTRLIGCVPSATITETRSVATIEAELQRAQPGAATVWRAIAGYREVTLPESGEACATVLALRQAVGTAQRRDTLEADLHHAETQLARLPAITTAEPQPETAATLITG